MTKLSTLCYIEWDNAYLMLHRVTKKNDINKDKWIGVGGHFEEGESPEECVLREVKEETGYTLTSYRYRGLVTFVSYTDAPEPDIEYMSLFTADGFEGEEIPCDEGKLEWVDKEKVWGLNLWEGDKIFFRLLDEGIPFFSLKLVYDHGRLKLAALNGEPLELFDILKEDGARSGVTTERGVAHREGSLHPTAHTWIVRRKEGGADVLLQKRSAHKDSYPGCLDVSSAGHVPAGADFAWSAVREAYEELGLRITPEELTRIGTRRYFVESEFYGRPFRDNEFCYVYVYEKPVETDRLVLQESEVESVVWMDYQDVLRIVKDRSVPNCIFEEEIRMLGEYLGVYHEGDPGECFRKHPYPQGVEESMSAEKRGAGEISAEEKRAQNAARNLIIFTDSGDTIVDESTQILDDRGIVTHADLIPQAGEVLRALYEEGYRIALVADGEWESFQNVYRENGLGICFEQWIVSERVGEQKPAKSMFEAAMESMHLTEADKPRIVMVGNNLKKDVAGANRFGLTSVWLDWSPRYFHRAEEPDWQPDYTVKSPGELKILIDLLEAKAAKEKAMTAVKP